jgi:Peptidase family M23
MKKLFLLSLILLPLIGTKSLEKPAEAASCSDVKIQMSGNARVKRGRGWTACNGEYRLSFQSDGNLVLYNRAKEAIWATGTDGSNADVLAVQSDGNVVLYGQGRALWSTNTHRTGSVFAIQSDGNLVVYNRNRQPVFYTSTDGGQHRTLQAAAEWGGKVSASAPAPAQSNTNPIAPVPSMSVLENCDFGDNGQGCAGRRAVKNPTALHIGVDYPNDVGTNVRAICDGVVVKAVSGGEVWNRVTIIKHTNCAGYGELYAYYGHVDPNGRRDVSKGDIIGTLADPNGTMTPHLHFGLSLNRRDSDWGYNTSKSGWINPHRHF